MIIPVVLTAAEFERDALDHAARYGAMIGVLADSRLGTLALPKDLRAQPPA
jgi:hypothetical protein